MPRKWKIKIADLDKMSESELIVIRQGTMGGMNGIINTMQHLSLDRRKRFEKKLSDLQARVRRINALLADKNGEVVVSTELRIATAET